MIVHFAFALIVIFEAEKPEILKETYWAHRLNTLSANGINTKILYKILNTTLVNYVYHCNLSRFCLLFLIVSHLSDNLYH